jgi:hypothetical protein
MVFDSQRGRMVMFGGYDHVGYFNDTWERSGTTWTQVSTSGPSARQSHSMCYDSRCGRTLLFGGQGSGPVLGDTWKWDGATWSQVDIVGPSVPPARVFQAMAYDSQRARSVVFGGRGAGLLGDTWEFICGPTAPISYGSLATTATPPAMSGHALAPVPGGGLVLFGGSTGTGFPVLTYELQGGSWAKQYSLNNPMTRRDASLLLDPARQNNLLFGGRNPTGTSLNDTWTYAGGQWTYRSPTTVPPPRSEHRMAYDRVRNLAVLFGGKDATGAALDDQWSWDGTDWMAMTPASRPPARFAHGLAYDILRDRLVCYGGANATERRDDVWEWNGTAWTRVVPAPVPGNEWGPGNRDGFAMAYDPRAERVVVFGGETAAGCRADAWSWDGQSWTLHLPSGGGTPSVRRGTTLVHDPTANQFLLFAGGCGTALTNDLWSFELPVFWRWNAYGSGCVNSNGLIPGLSVVSGSTARLGQTLQMEVTNVPPVFSPSYGTLGLNRQLINGLPLPLDLGFLGLPGCLAWTSSEFSTQIGLPNPLVIWSLSIPSSSNLLGIEVYAQALTLASPGFIRWAAVSNAVTVRLGNQ